MKYLRWVGLMPSLLIVGQLGGLLAPLPSEGAPPSKAPTVTLKMDSGTTIAVNTTLLSSCPAGDITLGYNYCYSVPTGQRVGTSPKQFQIQPNGTPRVRVADKNGQDKMSLTGVKFVPVGSWPNTEVHTLTLTVSGTFDATTDGVNGPTINASNAGILVVALRSSGEFNANSGSDSVGNIITLTGVGTFSAANTNKPILSRSNPTDKVGTKNLSPLSFTIAGPAATADINWGGTSNTDMGQQDPYYPQFDCKRDYGSPTNAAACRPTITQTLVATIKGPDTLKVLSGPVDFFCVLCTETFSAAQIKQTKFLTGAVKIIKFLLPTIQRQDVREGATKLLSYLEGILITTTAPPSDPDCPGAQVLAFNAALEIAADGLAIIADNSSPGIPAPLHYYAVVSAPGLTWDQARAEAQGLGTGCDLATITSAAEQAIINGLLPDPASITESIHQYWIGGLQPIGSTEPGANWQWINEDGPIGGTGYSNWGTDIPGFPDQPDNATSPISGIQNHVALDHRMNPPAGWGWDDNDAYPEVIRGYVTEGTAGICLPPVID